MIGKSQGYFVGARPFDFTGEDGKRIVGATLFVASDPSGDDVYGFRVETYSCAPEVLAVLRDLKPFNRYEFGIELRQGWKRGKCLTIGKAA